jgi:hypothetical protein
MIMPVPPIPGELTGEAVVESSRRGGPVEMGVGEMRLTMRRGRSRKATSLLPVRYAP